MSSSCYQAGYREGITAGKETSAQRGFDRGFATGAMLGHDVGIARGLSTAIISCLTSTKSLCPDDLTEREYLVSEARDVLAQSSSIRITPEWEVGEEGLEKGLDAENKNVAVLKERLGNVLCRLGITLQVM